MIRRARLVGPPAGDPEAHVAGLGVLLRQLLSLQDAGIEEVVVEGMSPEQLPRDARLTLRVLGASSGGTAPELVARQGLVWHRLLPRRLALEGKSVDIEQVALEPGEFVVATADAAGRRQAEDLLFAALLKATDGIISRSINRKISLRVTRTLLETGITPNQMTILAALCGVLGIGLVAWGGIGWLVPGAVLLQVQSILDGCDGELSRLKYIRSRLGEWLDQVLDDIVNLGFFWVTAWVLWREGSMLAGWIGVIGVTMHLIYQLALYTGLIFRGGGSGSVTSINWWGIKQHGVPEVPTPPTLYRRIMDLLEPMGRRDFFTFLYLPAAIVGLPIVALAWCAIIFVAEGAACGSMWVLRGGPTAVER